MTKLKLLFVFLTVLIIISCDNSNTISLQGNWIRQAEFMGEPRGGAVSFTIGNDVFVGTGYRKTKYYGETEYEEECCLTSFYKYNLENGWTKIADLPGKARQEAVAFSINGKGYVGTGVDDEDNRLRDFYEYDPETNTWKGAPEFIGGARQGAVAFSINNIGYVGTGFGFYDGEDLYYLSDFYKFENGEWEQILFPGETTLNSTAFVINKKAYIVSGDVITKGSLINNPSKYVWEFNPQNDFHWQSKRHINDYNGWEDIQRFDATSFVINGKGYLTTGRLNSNKRTVWEYDPKNDNWIEKTALEQEIFSRENAVGFSINNRGFIVTGNITELYLADMWEFNPIMDKTDGDND